MAEAWLGSQELLGWHTLTCDFELQPASVWGEWNDPDSRNWSRQQHPVLAFILGHEFALLSLCLDRDRQGAVTSHLPTPYSYRLLYLSPLRLNDS